MAEPLVSVVIPTFNRARDLRRSLESLRGQTFTKFEVFVGDDGSTDNSKEVAAEYEASLDITYEWAPNAGGPAAPRNRGIRAARAPYVAFLDSDDWWLPGKLAASYAALESGADLVYHDLFVVTGYERRPWKRARTRAVLHPAFDDLLLRGNALATSSVVARTHQLREIGGFAEDRELIAVEDYDAWMRLAKITERFVRLPETLGCYWAGGGNITSPSRTLGHLAALERRYGSEGEGRSAFGSAPWVRYARGRAHYQLAQYSAAKPELKAVLRSPSPAPIRAKSLWMLAAMRIRATAERA